jgi:multidrug resistance efflux pump
MKEPSHQDSAFTALESIHLTTRQCLKELRRQHWSSIKRLRNWRALLGLGLFALLASTGTMTAVRRKAAEAYITGDLITVKSPIKGEVIEADLSTGELFRAGSLLIAVRASREQASKQQNTRLELAQVNRDLTATKQQLKSLLLANRARLSDELETATRELADLKGQESRYQQQVKRYRQLVQAGAMDAESLAGAQATLNSYQQRLQNQRRIVAELQQDLNRASAGMTQGSLALPDASRGLGLLELDISRLNDKLATLQSRQRKLEESVVYGSEQAEFRFKPSFNGLVLNKRAVQGSEVVAGETLFTAINCEALKAEAVFESAKLKDVQIGDSVNITTKSGGSALRGRVISLRGIRGIRAMEGTDSAQFKATNDDRTRMQIALPAEFRSGQCRLGEKIEVSL